MSFTQPFLLGIVSFRTALNRSGGFHLERGEMPFHDAVGINRKKGGSVRTTENQGEGVKYCIYRLINVCWMIVCVI